MLDILRKEDVAGEGGLSVRQKAVIRYADAMTKQVKVEEEVWVDLRRESGLDERGLVELTATIATYNMVARFVGALDVGEMNGIGGDEGGSKWGVK